MNIVPNCFRAIILSPFISLGLSMTMLAQGSTQATELQAKSVAVVLTSEFCSTLKMGVAYGIKQQFPVGRLTCARLASSIEPPFSKIRTLAALPKPSEVQEDFVLVPKFIDINITFTSTAWGKRQMIVLMEIQALDKTGNPIWIETIKGTGEHKMGSAFGNVQKSADLLTDDAISDLLRNFEKSVSRVPDFKSVSGALDEPSTGQTGPTSTNR
jgi:hypothetical protein